MAYDDGYYYGQCKIVAVVDNTADNGKTVLITTDDNKTYSGTIANKKCEFLLPPRTLYTVQKVSSGSTEFTTKVEAGYGDCILVHLDTGYVEVKQGDIVGLDYIKAATDANLKNKVPEAKAVKEVNNRFGGLKFGVDSDGNYGYIKAGADTVTPFKSGDCSIQVFASNYNNNHSSIYGNDLGYISNGRIYASCNVDVILSLSNTNNAYAYVNGVEKFGTYSGSGYFGTGQISMNAGDYLTYGAPNGGYARGMCVFITT